MTQDAEERAEVVSKALQNLGARVIFEKSLTSSDAASGRVVLPKAVAEKYLPMIEAANGTTIEVSDISGNVYDCKFRYWANGQSRMYLLEGTSPIQAHYKMRTTDLLIVAQRQDGSLIAAGRPTTKADLARKPPVKRASVASPPGRGMTSASRLGSASERDNRRGRIAPQERPPQPPHPSQPERSIKRAPSAGVQHPVPPILCNLHPPTDGVFRAVPNALASDASRTHQVKDGRWVASLNLDGEIYQAYFECQDDALEAFQAAGAAGVTVH